MQIGQLTSAAAEASGLAKKVEKKPPVKEAKSAVSQQAYKLDLRSEAVSRLDQVRARIASGYYNQPEIIAAIADRVINIL